MDWDPRNLVWDGALNCGDAGADIGICALDAHVGALDVGKAGADILVGPLDAVNDLAQDVTEVIRS